MKKIIFISTCTAFSLLAATIEIPQMPQNAPRVEATAQNVILSYNSSIKDAKKSVLNISTTKKSKQNEQLNEMMQNPFFKEFFGNKFPDIKPQEKKTHSLGSGVIISQDGYIVTNNHVVEGADEIIVTLQNDDKEYKAKVIGEDPKTDLAVIKIEATALHVTPFSDSSSLQEGDVVFAIGNPFGVGETITHGIISALNKNNVGLNQYENFIQTDASINPGNSGGALVDNRGGLIGINSAILSKGGGNNGVGFAIPSNMVQKIALSLIENGKVERGYIGVSISDLNNDLKELYDNKQGSLLVMVEKNSPAEKAGLQRGDLIIEIDGIKIKNSDELKNTIAGFAPDKTVNITVERDKKIKMTKVKLAKMDGETNINAAGKVNPIEGLSLLELNDKVKAQYQIPRDIEGLLITDVKDDSKAEKIGFKEGDIIIQVEQTRVTSLKDFISIFKDNKSNKKRIYINRQNFIAILVAP